MSGALTSSFQTWPEWVAACEAAGERPLVKPYLLAHRGFIVELYYQGLSQSAVARKMGQNEKYFSQYLKATRLRRVDLGFDDLKSKKSKRKPVKTSLARPPVIWPEWVSVHGMTPARDYLMTVKSFIVDAYEANYSGRDVATVLKISQSQLGKNGLSRQGLGFPTRARPKVRTDYPPCPYVWSKRPEGQTVEDYLTAITPWIIEVYTVGLSQSQVKDLCHAPSFHHHCKAQKLRRQDLGFSPAAASTKSAPLSYDRVWSERDDYFLRRGHYIGAPKLAVMAQVGCTRKEIETRCEHLGLGRSWPHYPAPVKRRRANEFDQKHGRFHRSGSSLVDADLHDFEGDDTRRLTRPVSGRLFVKPRV